MKTLEAEDRQWEEAARERGSEAYDHYVVKYAPLVKYIAHRIAVRLPAELDINDLIHDGILGLMDAIKKYDPDRNVQFKSYAENRIRGAILDGLRNLDWFPRSVRKNQKRLEETIQRLESEYGRPAEDEEIAEAMGLEMPQLHELIRQVRSVSIDRYEDLARGDDGEGQGSFLRRVADPKADDPYDSYFVDEVHDVLAHAIDGLPEKERLVISMYYKNELTMKEIGAVLELSESRVCQLHTKAVLRLRTKLRRLGVDQSALNTVS